MYQIPLALWLNILWNYITKNEIFSPITCPRIPQKNWPNPYPFIWNRYSLKVSIIKYLQNLVFVVKKELKIRNVINSNLLRILKVLGAGLEPARPLWPLDFKSNVSTNSTIRAGLRAKDGIWTRDPHLGKVTLYHWATFAKASKVKINF